MEKTMKTKKILSGVAKSIPWLLALTMLLTVAVIPASATDGYVCIEAAADTYIRTTGNPNGTHGLEEVLQVANRTGAEVDYTFLRFDLSTSIPAGSTITAVSLELYMEQPPTTFQPTPALDPRTYNLYWTEDYLNGTTTLWNDTNQTNSNMPTLQSQVASVNTGTSVGTVTWSDANLTSRVQTEFNGDKMVSFEIRDSANISGNTASLAKFTSINTTTTNQKPRLCVTFTPPSGPTACQVDGEPLLIDAFFQTAPGTVCLNDPSVCFDIEFDITACENLDNVKIQGGIGSNLIVTGITGYINNVPVPAGQGPNDTSPGRSTNTLINWLIPHLDADSVASIKVHVCPGTNPAGKQEFTNLGDNPITGNWSASAVLSSNKRIKVRSFPEYTEKLLVNVVDCAAPTSTP
jgi:hypothetical protein